MRYGNAFLIAAIALAASARAEPLPIADGVYVFKHRFAEHPNMESIHLDVTIHGNHILLVNNDRDGVFPLGDIDGGELYWHAASGQWIIVSEEADKLAEDVGGCSDGPAVVDLIRKIYWTC